jgi:DeoR/GlpR family transcriptional regulator of sugar metabolism
MKFEDYQEKLLQISKLIQYSNTGSPKELAKRLHVSERTVRRLVDVLKSKDESIVFCRKSRSYILKN